MLKSQVYKMYDSIDSFNELRIICSTHNTLGGSKWQMAAGVAGTSQKAKYNPHVPVRIVGSKQNFLYSLDSHLPQLPKAAPFQEEYKIFFQTSSHQ